MEIDNVIKVTVGAAVAIIMVVAFAIPVFSGFTESSQGSEAANNGGSAASLGVLYDLSEGQTIELNTTSKTTTVNEGSPQEMLPTSIITDTIVMTWIANGDYHLRIGDVFESDLYSNITLSYDNGVISGTATPTDGEPVDINEPTKRFVMYVEKELNGIQTQTDYQVSIGLTTSGWVNENTTVYAVSSNITIGWGDYKTILMKSASSDNPDETITPEIIETNGDAICIKIPLSVGYLYVPTDYYIELPNEPEVSGAAATIIDILPLIMVVGILVAVAGTAGLVFLNRRS